MTFSIIARESAGDDTLRFGVGVTTNNPGIGVFAPAVSAQGAVATQYQTYGEVGPQIVGYLDDGLRAEDALPATLNATETAAMLQVHAIGEESTAVHHGDGIVAEQGETEAVFGDVVGDGYSVAGNTLANQHTLDATAEHFAAASPDQPLAARLIEALVAGDDAGGDRREADARSAAIKVVDPTAGIANEWYNDLRVDASPSPLTDLQRQYDRARQYHDEASAEWS
jgi:uncharacterized Ntn-hydrolase superfamily protein